MESFITSPNSISSIVKKHPTGQPKRWKKTIQPCLYGTVLAIHIARLTAELVELTWVHALVGSWQWQWGGTNSVYPRNCGCVHNICFFPTRPAESEFEAIAIVNYICELFFGVVYRYSNSCIETVKCFQAQPSETFRKLHLPLSQHTCLSTTANLPESFLADINQYPAGKQLPTVAAAPQEGFGHGSNLGSSNAC